MTGLVHGVNVYNNAFVKFRVTGALRKSDICKIMSSGQKDEAETRHRFGFYCDIKASRAAQGRDLCRPFMKLHHEKIHRFNIHSIDSKI